MSLPRGEWEMWLWASPLNTRFTEYLPRTLISHLRVLNIELLFFSIFNWSQWQQTFFLVLVLMTRRYGKNLLMFLKDKSVRTIRKQRLRQSVIESILGVAEFQGRNLCRWILRKLIVNHRWHDILSFINKLCSFEVPSHQNHDFPLTTD